jgi:hypothetical protein
LLSNSITTFSSIELAFKLYVPGRSRILALIIGKFENLFLFNCNSRIISQPAGLNPVND